VPVLILGSCALVLMQPALRLFVVAVGVISAAKLIFF
jgi:hypothetical protein